MKANWTTKNGKEIEINVTHKDGVCVETKISINGEEQKGRIEKAQGIWAVAVVLGGKHGYISLPAEIKKEIDADCAASKKPLVYTAADLAYYKKLETDYLFQREMSNPNSEL